VENTPRSIPFNVGVWEGPNGQSVLAALNPGAYDGHITADLSSDRTWSNRINLDGKVSGVFADYHYYGTGDRGGAPPDSDARMIEAIVDKTKTTLPRGRGGRGRGQAANAATNDANAEVQMGEGPVRVVSSKADQMFLDILAMKPDATPGLPRWKGDLEMTDHGVGAYSSEAYHKRWNRKKELLADAAEKSSVAGRNALSAATADRRLDAPHRRADARHSAGNGDGGGLHLRLERRRHCHEPVFRSADQRDRSGRLGHEYRHERNGHCRV
jgi:alpha-mannosidase